MTPDWGAALLAQLPYGLALCDESFRVSQANAAFAELFGNDVTGKRLQELLPKAEVPFVGLLTTVAQSGQPFADLEIAAGDKLLYVTLFPAPPGIGVLVRTAPITREQSSESIFRSIFDHAPVCMVVFDWHEGGMWINDATAQTLGYSKAELARVGIQGITHPEDYDRDSAEFQRLMSGEIDHYQLEKRYLRRDGSVMWGRLFISIARSTPSQQLIIAMIEDITKRREADAQREQLVAALREAVRAREVFLSIASHELKTPLTPLKLNLQLLAQKLSREVVGRELDIVLRQVDRLTALVDKLLDVSRVSTGRLELAPEPVDLGPLVREIGERFRPEAARSGSQLTVSIDAPATVSADRLRLEQVVANLLSNAIKFGEGKPIDMRLEHVDDSARLSVRDHGVGIAPEEQARIFGRFERAAPNLAYGGLGLGLYIVREVVEAHGGSVAVASAVGQGATFVVTLPTTH